jgi:hypothetical protein
MRLYVSKVLGQGLGVYGMDQEPKRGVLRH